MRNTDKENAPPGGDARGRYAVTIEMRDGPETIALKVANLRIAADAA